MPKRLVTKFARYLILIIIFIYLKEWLTALQYPNGPEDRPEALQRDRYVNLLLKNIGLSRSNFSTEK